MKSDELKDFESMTKVAKRTKWNIKEKIGKKTIVFRTDKDGVFHTEEVRDDGK